MGADVFKAVHEACVPFTRILAVEPSRELNRMPLRRRPLEAMSEPPVLPVPSTTVPPSFPLIWSVIAKIPVGSVASYGEIARRAQLPRRARLVAQALRAAPDALDLPWFRVIRSDGKIAFAPGSVAFVRQRGLLVSEGIEVLDNGRVCAAGKAEDGDNLDAALWRQ